MAGLPVTETPRGGVETGFAGESSAKKAQYDENGVNPMAGLGYVLEQDDESVFQHVDALVRRENELARNRLAIDTHWAYMVTGYPFSTLTKDQGTSVYRQTLPYGIKSTKIQAVPNKAWDLLGKTTELLLVDMPIAVAEPLDDSEEADAACDLANHFLELDAGEQGTNDAKLFSERVMRALFASSSFVEAWIDPAGGGYVPLQILAHPEAPDPQNPEVGPDGNPTPNLVLRYLTDLPENGGQFTDDPAQAAPQWVPKIRAAKWNREHVRVYPETAAVEDAEKVVILGHCTISEARRRWPTVAEMDDEALAKLLSWQPENHLALLPPFQRNRWKLTDGKDKERQGASDERTIFYYHIYVKPCPDYRKGADVVVSGASGGLVIDRKLLAHPVERKIKRQTTTEIRCREIPVVQVTLLEDPFDGDPMGRSFIELFSGAVESNANLAVSFQQLIDKIVRTPYMINSTSPISGRDVKNARATEDFLLIKRPDDRPFPLTPSPVPTDFFRIYELSDEAVNSIAAQNRPAQGSDKQAEVSGRAREIAVQQNNISNTSKLNAVNAAVIRWNRIKLELAMSEFTAEQQLSFIGEDGSARQVEWSGVDFALVGKVALKKGSGTMMTPDQKVQYLGNLQAAGLVEQGEAAEGARPLFSKRLGLAPDPHEQFITRCIEQWKQGPPPTPEPTPENPQPVAWVDQYRAWKQAQDAYQAQLAQYQQLAQLQQEAEQMTAVVNGGPPPTNLGPEQQNEGAMDRFQMAREWLMMNGPRVPQGQLQPPPPPQVPAPWTPFPPRPNETEPYIAGLWTRKLSRVQSTARYDDHPPEWRDVLNQKYMKARQAVATASGATPGSPPATQPVGAQQPQQAQQSPQFPGPRPNGGLQPPRPGQPQHPQQSPHTPNAAKAA